MLLYFVETIINPFLTLYTFFSRFLHSIYRSFNFPYKANFLLVVLQSSFVSVRDLYNVQCWGFQKLKNWNSKT